MRRSLGFLATSSIVATLACASMAGAETYFGFTIGLGNAPPPPRLVFEREPAVEVVVVSGRPVNVVQDVDCDMFRYGSYWYVSDGAYWYRAPRYRGPFVAVDVRRVPRTVLSVPGRHWKHHPHGGSPGHFRRSRGHRG